jgi:hypothetical protein
MRRRIAATSASARGTIGAMAAVRVPPAGFAPKAGEKTLPRPRNTGRLDDQPVLDHPPVGGGQTIVVELELHWIPVGFYFRNPRESFPLISREQCRTVISREQFRTVPWVNFVTPHLLLKFVIDN